MGRGLRGGLYAVLILAACLGGCGPTNSGKEGGVSAERIERGDGMLRIPPPDDTSLSPEAAWQRAQDLSKQLTARVQANHYVDDPQIVRLRQAAASYGYFAAERGVLDAQARVMWPLMFSPATIPPRPAGGSSKATLQAWRTMLNRTGLYWLNSAADHGSVRAQSEIGTAFLGLGGGFSVECPEALSNPLAGRTACKAEGERRLRQAADGGYAYAQERLGMYLLDQARFKPEPEKTRLTAESLHYYRLAAAQDDLEAMRTVIFAYRTGLGVPVDLQHAMTLARQAAEKNPAMQSEVDAVQRDIDAPAKAAREAQEAAAKRKQQDAEMAAEQKRRDAEFAAEQQRRDAMLAAMTPAQRHAYDVTSCRSRCSFTCNGTNIIGAGFASAAFGGGLMGFMAGQNEIKACRARGEACVAACGN